MFLHSIPVQEQAISADGVYTFDLAVNPLSVVLVCLRPLNDTGTKANFCSYRDIAAAMNRVSILDYGRAVYSMRGEDAAALAYFRHGCQFFQGYHNLTDNDRRCCVVPLFLGRHAYDEQSCFPATPRGGLTLELDLDIADTGYDGLRLSVETIELPNAKPIEYERKVSIAQSFAATNDSDLQIPPGQLIRGLLLFGTTAFSGASPAPTWGRMKVLLDNAEQGYSATDFEVAQGLHCLWGRQPPTYDAHKHLVTTDGNAQTELASLGGPYNIGVGYENYAFLNYDVLGDDSHSLDTSGKSSFAIRSIVETANAVRVIPIERIKV